MSIEIRNNPDLSQPGYYILCDVRRVKIETGISGTFVSVVPDLNYVGPFPTMESAQRANECNSEMCFCKTGNVVRVE